MPDKKLIIFGAGELAEVADFYFNQDFGRAAVAFAIDGDHIKGSTFGGRPVIAFEEIAASHAPDAHDMFVAVGYSKINALRRTKCEAAISMGYGLTSYVSPRASIAGNVRIGWNAFIQENNVIQPFVRIGNGVTVWATNHIGHHASIDDFAFISSMVVISGGCGVGEQSFMGVNSTVNDHVQIGARCIIGSASLIAKDLADESVVSSEPARISPVKSSRLRGF